MPKRTSQLPFHFSIFLEERIPSILLLLRRIRYGYPFRKIPLTKGLFAIVDPDDYDRLIDFNWQAHKSAHTNYAVRSIKIGKYKTKLEYMHHLIIDVPEGLFCDHINHNGLDNRKANLRPATLAQNIRHRRKFKSPSRSKYKGLTWRKKENAWHVRIYANGKRIFLGSFKDELEAAHAYDSAAKQYYGQFAELNFLNNQ